MKQGEIWHATLDPIEGSKQLGFRPVLIVSGNLVNEHAPVVICCPLTTKLKYYKGDLIIEPDAQNGLKKQSEVMVIHIRSLSKTRLKQRIGKIPIASVSAIKNTINDLLNF